MTTSILIPFRGDGGTRDDLWNHLRPRWERMPYELVIGREQGHGPFNISQAFNDAASRATGDNFILFGADQLPYIDRIRWGIEHLEAGKPWVALFAETAGMTRTDTYAILNGYQPDKIPVTQVAPFCTAIVGVRRDKWIKFDERFQGWGGEDTAHRLVLETLYGPSPEPTGRLHCLWHEAAPRTHTEANFALIGEYITAEAEGRMEAYVQQLGLL